MAAGMTYFAHQAIIAERVFDVAAARNNKNLWHNRRFSRVSFASLASFVLPKSCSENLMNGKIFQNLRKDCREKAMHGLVKTAAFHCLSALPQSKSK